MSEENNSNNQREQQYVSKDYSDQNYVSSDSQNINLESEVSPLNAMQSGSGQNLYFPNNNNSSSSEMTPQPRSQSSIFRSKIPGSEFFAQLLELTSDNHIQRIMEILRAYKNIEIRFCKDSKGYNLIHKAILNNSTDLVRYFIDYAVNVESQKCTEEKISQENIAQWVNQQTQEDRFTAVHLASFRGLTEIMELLDEYGADFEITNIKGTNVIHFAAQGDQPKSLVYLKNKGLDLNMLDDKSGTALHWASFLGNESSVNYLVSWDIDLNRQDNDGLTPLHLATLMGFSRIVKKLLIRGADRELEDEHGKTPFDIAEDKRYPNIMNMIKTNACSFSEYCNIKPAFKPVKNPRKQVMLFMLMYWLGMSVYVVFDFPFFDQIRNNFWCSYYSAGIVFFNMIFFLISWQKDPGQLKSPKDKQNNEHLLELLKKVSDPSKICPDCKIIKPERSRHCEICKSCIMVYDHHCPWINNCVGAKNHRYFFVFISLMWINLFSFMTIMVSSLSEQYGRYNYYFTWFNQDFSHGGFRPPYYVKDIFLILNLVLAGLFAFPLTFLIIVQINNLFMGKTTFERYNHQAVQAQSMSQASMSIDVENNGENSNITQSLLSQDSSQMQSTLQQSTAPNQNQDMLNTGRNWSNCGAMCCGNQKESSYFNTENYSSQNQSRTTSDNNQSDNIFSIQNQQ